MHTYIHIYIYIYIYILVRTCLSSIDNDPQHLPKAPSSPKRASAALESRASSVEGGADGCKARALSV